MSVGQLSRQSSSIAADEVQQCAVADKVKEQLDLLVPCLQNHANNIATDAAGYTAISKRAKATRDAVFAEGKFHVDKEDTLLMTLNLLAEAQNKFVQFQNELLAPHVEQVTNVLSKWINEGYAELQDEKNMLHKLRADRDAAKERAGAEELERSMRLSMLLGRQQKRVRDVLDKLPNDQKTQAVCIKKHLHCLRDMHMACGNAANKPFMLLILNSQRID